MKKQSLTFARIEKLKPPRGKQYAFLWDKAVGFGVRITKNSAKSFIFESRLNGKTIRLTIGDCATWTISDARKAATRLKAMIDEGKDPRLVKVAQAHENAKAHAKIKKDKAIIGEAWESYLTHLNAKIKKNGRKLSALHLRDHANIAKEAAPLHFFMDKPLSAINQGIIKSWLAKETAHRPTRAALAYRILRAFINWINEDTPFAGTADGSVFLSRKIKDMVPNGKVKVNDCLQKEQLSAWFGEVLKISNPAIRVYLQGLLLTGARREELMGLCWGNVDFKW